MIMLAGVRKYPQDAALWTGLGLKLAEKDGDIISPASKFAFDRAMALAPQHPGPPYFLGVAYLQAGNVRSALPMWSKALQLTPENASYHNKIAGSLYFLERAILEQAQARQKAAQQHGMAPAGQPAPTSAPPR
jgi:cytochrome c-type biogenesis protein CcmH/NrfG